MYSLIDSDGSLHMLLNGLTQGYTSRPPPSEHSNFQSICRKTPASEATYQGSYYKDFHSLLRLCLKTKVQFFKLFIVLVNIF